MAQRAKQLWSKTMFFQKSILWKTDNANWIIKIKSHLSFLYQEIIKTAGSIRWQKHDFFGFVFGADTDVPNDPRVSFVTFWLTGPVGFLAQTETSGFSPGRPHNRKKEVLDNLTQIKNSPFENKLIENEIPIEPPPNFLNNLKNDPWGYLKTRNPPKGRKISSLKTGYSLIQAFDLSMIITVKYCKSGNKHIYMLIGFNLFQWSL